MRKLWRKRI